MTEMGFADLGLENPGAVEMPTFGLPLGTHRAFVKSMGFAPKANDSTKKNVVFEFEINEPGNPAFGQSGKVYKASNPDDSAKTKGFTVDFIMSVANCTKEEVSKLPYDRTLNTFPTVVGKPVYIVVTPQKDNPRYTQINNVYADTDSEHVSVPNPPVGNTGSHAAPAAVSTVDY
jgi:hypothetical protein